MSSPFINHIVVLMTKINLKPIRLLFTLAFLFTLVLAGCQPFFASTKNTPALTPTPAIPNVPGAECVSAQADRISAELVRVIDGDTIVVLINGEEKHLRYIGLDAPESGDPGGAEATAKNLELVEGQPLLLFKDQSETDSFGRLLRYVFAGETFVNYELIRSGFAEAKFWDDVACQQVFTDAGQQARTSPFGLVNIPSTPDVAPQPAEISNTPAAASSACPAGCTDPQPGCQIKGNINSEGVKIYHVPGSNSYDQTVISPHKGELWFCSEEEALANGWRAPKN